MTEIGTLLQDRYLIERKIGTGGMGAVYLAVDRRFDNHVAIKETFYKDEEFAEAFEREARLLNALQHPVLPHVSDYFAENEGYFLVMQFIEGEDLSDVLTREGAFPVQDVLRWTDELLDALDYLHSQEPPVIHRDIKPHNLKLTLRGSIMLLDFGLAKVSRQDASEISVFGYSRTYSPLEQVQGTGTDARSDIFALGATVYHLLTGTPPVNALTRAAAIVGGNPDPLKPANELRPEISAPVASVIETALALNAENRFVSAKAMRQALEYALGEESTKVRSSAVDGQAISGASVETVGNKPSESISQASPIIVDLPRKARVRRPDNQKRIIWAAAAALLLFGIATAFYLSSRGNSAGGANQPVVNASSTNGNTNRESLAESRKKTAEKTSADEAKSETGNRSKTPEQPAAKSASTRKNQASENEEIVTDEEMLPETEIVPQEPTENRRQRRVERRQSERPIPDEMSEEEFQQIQREERQRRREQRRKPPDQLENESENN